VSCSSLETISVLAPVSQSTRTIWSYPFKQALCNGVQPALHCTLTLAPCCNKSRTSSNFPAAAARWSFVSPAWFLRVICEEAFDDTRGELKGGVMEEGGGIDSEDRREVSVDIDVATDDSLDLADRTSISSPIGRFRFRDMVEVFGFVLMEAKAAAAALRFVVVVENEFLCRLLVSDEEVVDRV
jgi:hypothetical protein